MQRLGPVPPNRRLPKRERRYFEPSERWPEPHAMVAANVFAADTDAQGRRLFTSAQQQFLNLIRGTPGLLPPPVETMDGLWHPHERALAEAQAPAGE